MKMISFPFFSLVCFFSFAEATVRTNLCDYTEYWTHYGNHCFKTFNKKLTWEDASNVCQLYDSELPTVTDKYIQAAIANISNSVQAELWTGIQLYQGVWVNSRYEQVNHSNQHWANEAIKIPNNNSCVVVSEEDGNPAWIIQDCKSTHFFACSKPEGTCPPGWIFHQRSCYRYINTLQTSWNHSSEYCQLIDSTLLEITELDRQIFIQGLVQSQQAGIENDDRLWLNLQKDVNGQWFWASNGTKTVFTNWFNDTDESEFDCAYIDVGREGKWFSDVPCVSVVSTACFFDVGSINWHKNMLKKSEEVPTPSECGNGWTDDPLGDSCYLLNKEVVTWLEAESRCEKVGAHLISLNSIKEQGYVSGFLHSSKTDYFTLWIGANSREDGKGFGWSDGSPFVFYNWFPGQPDGQSFATEECSTMFTSNGKWSDVSCDQRHSFICEKSRPSELRTTTTPNVIKENSYGCPDGWKPFRNHCILIERQKLSWMEARQFCIDRNGVLASVKDENEQNFLYSQLPSDYCFNIHPNDTHCAELAAAGKCSDEVQYMVKQCPAACGLCDKNCSDVYKTESCQAWAGNNGCETNPQWMFQMCKKSCGACDALFQGGFWLGLRDTKDQTFAWENGDDVSFSHWRKSEPQGYSPNQEGCTAMAYDTGLWFDRRCEAVMPGLICQAPKQQSGVKSSPGCNGNYISYESMCYSFVDEEASWSDAQTKCKSQNGNLATVNSRYIQAFLSSQLFGKSGNFWIGYREAYSNGTMELWNSGHLVDFQFGDIIDSSTLGMAEACAAMRTTVPVGIWSFLNCSATQQYICETLREGFTTTMIPSSTTAPLLCPDSWIPLDGHCFKAFVNKTSWHKARDYCRGINADLSSIHSDVESQNLRNHGDLPRDGEYWVGLSDLEKEGNWLWTDGTLFDFKPWMAGEPDNWNNIEHCARYRASDRTFSDVHCSFKLPFICKVQKGVPVIEHFQPNQLEKCTDERFLRLNASCFSVIRKETTFYEAQRLCREIDAELASIHDREENTFLANIAIESSWIGIKISPSNGFQWIDGSPLDFTSWSQNEPYNYLSMERCAATQNELWNDHNCGKVLGGFICKKSQSSGSSTESPPVIDGVCPPLYQPSLYNSKCYKIVTNPSTWTAAKSDCEKTKGASLLSVEDQAEQDYIINLLKRSKTYIWIGFRRVQNQFLWENNKEVTYTNWKNEEPNMDVGVECTEIQGSFDLNVGKWNTAPCTYLRPYICEAPKDPTLPEITSSACPQNYTQNEGSCYRFFNDFPLDWESANHFCSLQNGTLAAISTIYRFGFIEAMGLKYKMKTYWIGLRKSNTSVLFKWRNGLPYLYTHWDQSKPTETPGQDCVLSHNNKWRDTSCNIRLPFLCEIIMKKPFLPPPSISCHKSAMPFNGACYYIELKHTGTWTDALNMCQQHNMDLVSIHSDIEMEHVREFVVAKGAKSAVWIGLSRRRLRTDPIGKVDFYWSDNSKIDYTYWNVNQPSDTLFGQLEECVEMFTDGTWNDVSCENIRGFICKDSVTNRRDLTTVVNDVINSTDNSENTTQLFYAKSPKKMKSSLISKNKENPRVVFAVLGVVVGLLLLLFVIGTMAYFIKHRTILPSPTEPTSSGFENAMYCKDEDNVNITEI